MLITTQVGAFLLTGPLGSVQTLLSQELKIRRSSQDLDDVKDDRRPTGAMALSSRPWGGHMPHADNLAALEKPLGGFVVRAPSSQPQSYRLPLKRRLTCAELRRAEWRPKPLGRPMHETGVFLFCLGIALFTLSLFASYLTRIAEGIEYMADAQAQALADLSAAVVNAITSATTAISAAASTLQPDDSAAIEAQVKKLNDFAASVAPVAAPAAPTA